MKSDPETENYDLALDTPVAVAKRLIRLSDKATVEFQNLDTGKPETLATELAADVGGGFIMFLERGGALYEAILETDVAHLTLPGNTEAMCGCEFLLDEEHVRLATERFAARHKGVNTGGQMIRLSPQTINMEWQGETHTVGGDAVVSEADLEIIRLERRIVSHMNDDHRDAVRGYARVLLGEAEGDWRLASLDIEGLDLVCDGKFRRLWFNPPLAEHSQITKRLVELAMRAGV